jgi:hypothetical protein
VIRSVAVVNTITPAAVYFIFKPEDVPTIEVVRVKTIPREQTCLHQRVLRALT